jgi:hypothetical protein
MPQTQTAIQPVLFSDVELARYLGVSLSCLRKWRTLRVGPPWLKLGALVRYRMADVNAYLDKCPVGGVVGTAEEV